MDIPQVMIVSKTGYCPILKDKVSLWGEYETQPDGTHILVQAHCSIIENVLKPVSEQDASLGDKACESPKECPLYSGFPPFAG